MNSRPISFIIRDAEILLNAFTSKQYLTYFTYRQFVLDTIRHFDSEITKEQKKIHKNT
jgi:hypothetical protein